MIFVFAADAVAGITYTEGLGFAKSLPGLNLSVNTVKTHTALTARHAHREMKRGMQCGVTCHVRRARSEAQMQDLCSKLFEVDLAFH